MTMPTIETVSGKRVDLVNPRPEDILVDDIAWVLSRTGRMNGHTISEIQPNNADHSILVAELVASHIKQYAAGGLLPDHRLLFDMYLESRRDTSSKRFGTGISLLENELILKALFHDAAEYITGDIPTPVKMVTGVKELFADLESKIEACICKNHFMPEYSEYEHKIIKVADLYAQRIEHFNYLRSRGDCYNWVYTAKTNSGVQLLIPINISVEVLSIFRSPKPAKESYLEFMKHYKTTYRSFIDARGEAFGEDGLNCLLNAVDNLNDLPISEEWAQEWVKKAMKVVDND